MPVRGVVSRGCRTCGARCRTKGGAPCMHPAMRESNRCRMHNGHARKRRTHGRLTILAEEERKGHRNLLKGMKAVNTEIETLRNGEKEAG
jgi:hypothetical protein